MNPKKIILILLFILALQFVLGTEVLAKDIEFTPSILIGDNPQPSVTVDGGFDELKGYISRIYKFGMSVTGILAVIVLALGGITWLTSGGNANQIGKAKQYIWGSMTGLVLALLSYTLLNLVNPEIVKLTTTEEISALQAVSEKCGWEKTVCDERFQEKKPDSECGNKPLFNGAQDGSYKHCCCHKKTTDVATLALQECDKVLNDEDAFSLSGASTLGGSGMNMDYVESLCEEKCKNQDGAKSWDVVNVVANNTNNAHGCCVCRLPESVVEGDQCTSDNFCKAFNPSYICCQIWQNNKCVLPAECKW